MKQTIGIISAALCLSAISAQAAIVIAGTATGYHSSNKDWLTNTTNDIDGNGLGTDGYIFFGDFDGAGGNVDPGNDGNENIFSANQMNSTLLTASKPIYISTAATVAGTSSSVGSFSGYEQIDNPLIGDGTDGIAANLLSSGSGEVVSFTLSGLATGTTVRVGIVTVLNDDNRGRFAIPQISLTDGTNTATVTGLPNRSSSANTDGPGWVFFDIDSDGTYTVAAPGAAPNPQVGGIGGITFDSIPEPSTAFLGALGALALLRRRR